MHSNLRECSLAAWHRWRRPTLLVLRAAQLFACSASLALAFGTGPSIYSKTGQVLQTVLALLAFLGSCAPAPLKKESP
jgi:hypothetical protein